jgi:hypothetical protein
MEGSLGAGGSIDVVARSSLAFPELTTVDDVDAFASSTLSTLTTPVSLISSWTSLASAVEESPEVF